MIKAPVCTYGRHRILSDGEGITTLVIFHGCPLNCRWCINDYTRSPDTKVKFITPQELYDIVKIDNLYFCATNGGITFGGGEPLLYPDFIEEFCRICPSEWNISVQTSLAVPLENMIKIAQVVDKFYIDCKDVNPEIYKKYTGCDNKLMLDNLMVLLSKVSPDKIVLRIPLIPEYNTEENQKSSRIFLEELGVTQFDEFAYIKDKVSE